VPVFVDGMVRSVCGVYGRHERYVPPGLAREIRASGDPFFTERQRQTPAREERIVLKIKPIWCACPGAALLRLAADEGPRRLRLGDRTVDVRCRFASYSLSAHADRMQMVGLIEALRPSTVLLVHGDRDAKAALAASLGVEDVQLAQDGDQFARSYAPRTVVPKAAAMPAGKAAALMGADAGGG